MFTTEFFAPWSLCLSAQKNAQGSRYVQFLVRNLRSASPKRHPSKPHPCNMPQAKTDVALQFSKRCAAEVALQHGFFCSADIILTKSCAAASKKMQCNIEKAALQESGAFLPLSCGFQAPTFRHPRLGPADQSGKAILGVTLGVLASSHNLSHVIQNLGQNPGRKFEKFGELSFSTDTFQSAITPNRILAFNWG